MKLDEKNQYQARLERFTKAFLLEEPDRIPVEIIFDATFCIQYAGYSLTEGTWDINKAGAAIEKCFADFEFDYCRSFTFRSPQFYKVLGAKTFIQSNKGYMQHPEVHGLEPNEYREFIENPFGCLTEKVIPRLYTELDQPKPYNMVALIKAMHVYNTAMAKYRDIQASIAQKFGVPMVTGGAIEAPMDFVADFIRGFSGIVLDIRRNPDEVEAACEAAMHLMIKKAMTGKPGITSQIFIPLHMPAFLREQQFARFYWPTFKKMIATLAEAGHCFYIFFEGDWARYYDYLQELPAKKIIAKMEYGDPKLAKEKLGKTMCITGFFPQSLLANGTKQQCVDKIKELIEVLAPGGGYMFSADKNLIGLSDVNMENYHAVIDYLFKHGNY
ncbi:MAG: uroporphyrinogen decarboxylase [Tepidanaerobacteraceae bacterium]|jgi:hypothetical protein|nr:uroporphyrinogen decarboxylase [Tepidanaerobacteraceae bacterium]